MGCITLHASNMCSAVSMAYVVHVLCCTFRKTALTTRILGLVHQLCAKRIHVTKRDLFYTDVKLFEVW